MVGLNTRQDKLGIAARHAESLGGIPRMPFGVAPAQYPGQVGSRTALARLIALARLRPGPRGL